MTDIKDARSISATTWSDQMNITINIRFLVNVIAVVGAIVYTYHTLVTRIDHLEAQAQQFDERIDELQSLHDQEVEELKKWYQEFSLNPFKRKK
tara:strand:+ start:277 stop:558 length:282 start_codon:yes stop_codon:yes gene_type:complete